MGTKKTCKIFLASSIDEMQQQRLEFGDFIRKLSDIYRPRGVDITVKKCEDSHHAYSGRPTEEELHDEVRNSDVLVALFYQKCGEYTVQEFDVACKSLAANNKPIVIVAIQNAETRTPELEAFIEKVDKDKGIFHWRFDTKEKLHFDFVMWFLQSEFAVGDSVTVEDGTVKIGDLTVAQFSQLPFAANNEEYQRLEDSLTSLNEDIEQIRQDIQDYPDNTKFPERLSKKVMEREKVQEELKRQQESLLGAAKRIAQIEKEKVSKKLQEAIDAFDAGQLERANTLLDQIVKDAEGHVEQLDQNRDLVHQDIDALLLKTQTVMAEAEKPIDERIARVAEIYVKADDWARRSYYDKGKYVKLLFDYAQFYYKYGPYDKGIRIYTQQIALSEELFGKDSPDTATSYNNIGTIYFYQSNFGKALEFLFKALEIREKALGSTHRDTAESYNNIGLVYNDQGNYLKALEFHFKALEILKRVFITEHSDFATSYNNIGLAYYKLGKYEKALEFHFKALKIDEKVLGPDNPDTAMDYDNINNVYHIMGDYDKALMYCTEALNIREKALGVNHKNTALSYNNIGSIYNDKGDYGKALAYHRKALAIYLKILGSDHQYTAASYYNIGLVYYHQGNYDKALVHYLKALEIDEGVSGAEHPDTAFDYNSIGMVYYCMGNYSKALENLNKAMDIRGGKLGHDHPLTEKTRNNIEIVNRAMNKSK